MRILFISFWSAQEPLTDSTIVPYLRFIEKMPSIEKVIFMTMERGTQDLELPWKEGLTKLVHRPIRVRMRWAGPLSKVVHHLEAVRKGVAIVKELKIDVINSRCSPAGSLAYLVHRLTGVPFMVESFEPHSGYMLDCGVWTKRGIYYHVTRFMERLQTKAASRLVSATWNYREHLIKNGVDAEKIMVVPSITDVYRFTFDPEARSQVRQQLGWTDDQPVGVYVGKFGGLYYDKEAFMVFRKTFKRVGNDFRMMILTRHDEDEVRQMLDEAGIAQEKVLVTSADHHEVPRWLSAADMAFSTIRYAPHGLYQSPVKDGEYWANGLPILLTNGVSDDHRIIQQHPYAGALFDLRMNNVDQAVDHMAELLEEGVDRERIRKLAEEHRSIMIAWEAYQELFGEGGASGKDTNADQVIPSLHR